MVSYSVDRDACVCSSFCVQVAPQYFEIREGMAIGTRETIQPEDLDLLDEASTLCPSGAIHIDDTES